MRNLSHYEKDVRPWGNFERFTLNENSTVKIITVNAGEMFSLQTHANREEFWRVIEGSGIITVGEEKKLVQKGDEFFIQFGVKHRAEAGAGSLVLLEIAFGDFDESDITRLDDKYGRV